MTADDRYDAAVRTFELEPEALTDAQIEVLGQVDDIVARRAEGKRAAALAKAADARHRAAMGEPALVRKGLDMDALSDGVVDVIMLALAHPRSRIKALEALVERLELRVLELEAQKATADVGR